MKPHEFIEVGDRRWCLGCNLFQQRAIDRSWRPMRITPCERTTPYAQAADVICETIKPTVIVAE